jgi:putative ABC transport system ATP-binding protein
MGYEKPTLRGRGLSRTFGTGPTRTIALRDASLDLYRGQVALIMGPSGSGKSTLLAALSGLGRPDAGQVIGLGEDLWRLSDRQRKHFRLRHCGFIFQGHNLFPALTARQHLEMVLRWGQGLWGRQARLQAEELLELLGLGDKFGSLPAQLSGGEQQRVAIARALIKDPTLCFADEPTGALDWAHGKQVIELLRDAAHQRGATIVVVAHDHRLTRYADRVFHQEDGSLTESAERHPAKTKASRALPVYARGSTRPFPTQLPSMP